MTKDEALRLALERINLHLAHHEHGCVYLDDALVAVIREALEEQPAQTKDMVFLGGWEAIPKEGGGTFMRPITQDPISKQPAQQETDSSRDEQEAPFEEWWEKHGQFLRAGGGQYEKTFAWHAWCESAKPAQQELGVECDCETATSPDGSRLTKCGSDQMRRAVEQGHAFCKQPAQQSEYERGFIDGMQKQMQSSVDRAVNRMAGQLSHEFECPRCGHCCPTQRKPLMDDAVFDLIEQDYRMEEYADAAFKLVRRTEAAHGIKE